MSSHTFSSLLALLVVEYLGIFLAVSADLVSGLRKARRAGRPCTSRGLRRTVAKLSSYYLALFCLTVVDGMIIAALITFAGLDRAAIALPPFPYLTTLGALSLALIEARSIAETHPTAPTFFLPCASCPRFGKCAVLAGKTIFKIFIH